MKICIIGPTALNWWLTRGGDFLGKRPNRLPTSFHPDYSKGDILALKKELSAKDPLHVLVRNANERTKTDGVREHAIATLTDQGLFTRVDERLWVAQPEHALIQSTNLFETTEAIYAASLLFSAFDPTTGKQRGPLTTKDKCLRALASQQRLCNARKARRIISLAAEQAASHREIQAFLLLCLPRKLGGYGLPRPTLNEPISLTKAQFLPGSDHVLRGDMFWKEHRVILEYESDKHHANSYQLQVDSRRRALFANEGYTVFTMTNNQVIYEAETHRLAKALSKALRYRLHPISEFKNERATLREKMLP